MRRSHRAMLIIAVVVAVALSVWLFRSPPTLEQEHDGAASPRFTDITTSSGLVFAHENGARGRRAMPEIMCGGAAWIDYDGDGLMDAYVVNANLHSARGGQGETRNELFRNLGDGRFENVTENAGVGDRGYGCGVAVGDYDNDGKPDLYVTNFGDNVLYRNEGNGRFRDVTAAAGVQGPGWSTSAAFADFDADGLLDLFVCQYVAYDPTRICYQQRSGLTQGDAPESRPSYCSPRAFDGAPDLLYRNRGDGTFEEISQRAGLAIAGPDEGKSLGVVVLDHDRDGG